MSEDDERAADLEDDELPDPEEFNKSLRVELERLRRLPPMRPASFYITLIVGLSGLAVGTILMVLHLRPPPEDNTAVIVGVFGFIGPSIAAILGVMLKDVHTMVNSRMDALLLATERAASAEGRAEGKAAQQDIEAKPKSKPAKGKVNPL